jgi:hypothetical protein
MFVILHKVGKLVAEDQPRATRRAMRKPWANSWRRGWRLRPNRR